MLPRNTEFQRFGKVDLESEVGKSILRCDEKGPAVMMVTTINVDPQAGRIATGRLFSGTIKDGDEVYLIDAKRSGKVQSVNIYMGNTREVVGMLPSGNIPALLGLDYAVAGETIATVKKYSTHLNQSNMSQNLLLRLQ